MGPIEKIRFALTGHPVAQRIDFIDAISHPRQGVFDVLIAEDDLLTRDISLPKMAKSALDSAVRLNVSAETPFDLETIAYAYKVLRKDKEKPTSVSFWYAVPRFKTGTVSLKASASKYESSL